MNDRIEYLYKRYCAHQCSPAEWEELMRYLEDEQLLARLMDQSWDDKAGSVESLSADHIERMRQQISETPQAKKRSHLSWYVSAAAVICATVFSIHYFQAGRTNNKFNTAQNFIRIADVPPGRDNAVLILGNGKQIDLEKLANNEVITSNHFIVRKKQHGWIVVEQNKKPSALQYVQLSDNIIRTPRGGEYKVTLPDGSLVTLNALSSLQFPDIFSKVERKVTLSGEGFFEVKHKNLRYKRAVPFIVHTENHEVKVLGTAFNVQAYPQQNQSLTTLVRGVVKIGTAAGQLKEHTQILKPGEQAAVSPGGSLQVKNVDLEEVTAWKEGYFLFNNQTLPVIMDQVARWYDVDLEYAGKATSVEFFGIYSRSKSLKFLLQNLEKTGKVRFEILSASKKKERRIKIRISYT